MTENHFKAIGGYFELALPPERQPAYPSALMYQSARAAFHALLTAERPKRVWMPSYICDSMLAPLIATNTEIIHYHIDSSFDVPSEVQLAADDWLLYVNYFGICDAQEKSILKRFNPEQIILDHSQGFYSPPADCLATIYSPRKFFGVPDGGLLITKRPLQPPCNRDDSSVARYKHLLMRIDQSPEAGYQDFKNSEDTFAALEPRRISKVTERVLNSIDMQTCRTRRNENFRYLHENLGKLNQLQLDDQTISGALCYPLLLQTGSARTHLIGKRIFIPTYWPEVANRSAPASFNMQLLNNCLPLPCDHRYSIEDMSRIVACVKEATT